MFFGLREGVFVRSSRMLVPAKNLKHTRGKTHQTGNKTNHLKGTTNKLTINMTLRTRSRHFLGPYSCFFF